MRAAKPVNSPAVTHQSLKGLAVGVSLVGLWVASFGTMQTRAQAPSPQTPEAAPAQSTDQKVPASQPQSAVSPATTGAPESGAAPSTPPTPSWPANSHPVHAAVTWDSHGLHIDAANSSLHQILNDVASETGAKVEGLGADERVFGEYGPGQARDVLSQLLHGSGYNVLLIGDQGEGTPRQIVLSARHASTGPRVANPPNADNPDEDTPDAEPEEPQPIPRPGFIPPGIPRTPQEMRERQQQMQEMRRMQQMPPQQQQQPQ